MAQTIAGTPLPTGQASGQTPEQLAAQRMQQEQIAIAQQQQAIQAENAPEPQQTVHVITYSERGGYGSGTYRNVYLDGKPYGTIQIPKRYEGRDEEYIRSQYPEYKTLSQVTSAQFEQAVQRATAAKEAEHQKAIEREEEQKFLKGSFMGREAQARVYGLQKPERIIGIEAAKKAEAPKERTFFLGTAQKDFKERPQELTQESRKAVVESFYPEPQLSYTNVYGTQTIGQPSPAAVFGEPVIQAPPTAFDIAKARLEARTAELYRPKQTSLITGMPLVKTTYEYTTQPPTVSEYSIFGFPYGKQIPLEEGKTYTLPSLFGKVQVAAEGIPTRKATERDIKISQILGMGVGLTSPMTGAFRTTSGIMGLKVTFPKLSTYTIPKLEPTARMQSVKAVMELTKERMVFPSLEPTARSESAKAAIELITPKQGKFGYTLTPIQEARLGYSPPKILPKTFGEFIKSEEARVDIWGKIPTMRESATARGEILTRKIKLGATFTEPTGKGMEIMSGKQKMVAIQEQKPLIVYESPIRKGGRQITGQKGMTAQKSILGKLAQRQMREIEAQKNVLQITKPISLTKTLQKVEPSAISVQIPILLNETKQKHVQNAVQLPISLTKTKQKVEVTPISVQVQKPVQIPISLVRQVPTQAQKQIPVQAMEITAVQIPKIQSIFRPIETPRETVREKPPTEKPPRERPPEIPKIPRIVYPSFPDVDILGITKKRKRFKIRKTTTITPYATVADMFNLSSSNSPKLDILNISKKKRK